MNWRCAGREREASEFQLFDCDCHLLQQKICRVSRSGRDSQSGGVDVVRRTCKILSLVRNMKGREEVLSGNDQVVVIKGHIQFPVNKSEVP